MDNKNGLAANGQDCSDCLSGLQLRVGIMMGQGVRVPVLVRSRVIRATALISIRGDPQLLLRLDT